MQEIYWSSAISELQEIQKREYKEWVVVVHEKMVADESCEELTLRAKRSPSIESYYINYEVASPPENYMEESFTIHLGLYHIILSIIFIIINVLYIYTVKPG